MQQKKNKIICCLIGVILLCTSGCSTIGQADEQADTGSKFLQIKTDYSKLNEMSLQEQGNEETFIQVDNREAIELGEHDTELIEILSLGIATKSYRKPIVLIQDSDIYVAWDQQMAKYDYKGQQIWQLDVSEEMENGHISNIFFGEDYCFFMTEDYEIGQMKNEAHVYLGAVDMGGSLAWINKEPVSYGSVYTEGILIGDRVYVAGTAEIKDFNTMERDTTGTAPKSLVVTEFDIEGNELQSKAFGNVDEYDFCYDLAGSDELGLIITGRTIGGKGSLVDSKNPPKFCNYAICLDFDLSVTWLINLEENDSFAKGTLYIDGKEIYVAGTREVVENLAVMSQVGMVMLIDADNGRIIYKTMDYNLVGEVKLIPIDNGKQVFAWTNQDGGWVSILETGDKGVSIESFSVDFDVGSVDLLPNGYFSLIGTHIISTIPQPAFISSIWYDTCGVIGIYDSSGNEVSLRTIDEYEGAIVGDWLYSLN